MIPLSSLKEMRKHVEYTLSSISGQLYNKAALNMLTDTVLPNLLGVLTSISCGNVSHPWCSRMAL